MKQKYTIRLNTHTTQKEGELDEVIKYCETLVLKTLDEDDDNDLVVYDESGRPVAKLYDFYKDRNKVIWFKYAPSDK